MCFGPEISLFMFFMILLCILVFMDMQVFISIHGYVN